MSSLRFALLFAAALPLAADPIADVRAAVGRLTAREAIRGTYELQHGVTNEGKFGNEKFTGKAMVELEGDANGFRIVIPRPLLDQIEREEQEEDRNPELSKPTVSALSQIDPTETANAVDFAPEILRMLEGAKMVNDVTGTWQGKPARVMILRLADRLDKEDAGRVKIAENRLTLWLGSDLIPLAAEHVLNAKFSFLIFKGETKQKHSWHFAQVSDHLVRVRHEATMSSSGMGQKGNESIVATLRIHD